MSKTKNGAGTKNEAGTKNDVVKAGADSAAQKTRKDYVTSVTMPHATRVLADMLATARGLTRSEYFRFLVLRDIESGAVNNLVSEALAQGVKVVLGRPLTAMTVASPFAIQQENVRAALLDKYPFFDNYNDWEKIFDREPGGMFFNIPDHRFAIEEFVNLDVETIATLIAIKLETMEA